MEIERKYLIDSIPFDVNQYRYYNIEQAYLCTNPVIRIRRQDDDYFLTYKGEGLLEREEYNLPLTCEGYNHLLPKADGNVISKRRYLIPLDNSHTIELDIFDGYKKGLILAEVEFNTRDEADSFSPPEWFGKDVTFDTHYHNSAMSKEKIV